MPDLTDINENLPYILESIRNCYSDYNWDILWTDSHSHVRGWIMLCRLGDYTCETNISHKMLLAQRGMEFQSEVIYECAKKTIEKIDSQVKQDLKAGNLIIKKKIVNNGDGTFSQEYYNPPKTFKEFQNKSSEDNPFSLIDFSVTNQKEEELDPE
jgi:hypothetical protein